MTGRCICARFLTSDDRVRKVAAFVADHFRENVDPLGYKAFLVGVNREACACYKQALDELLPAEWTEAVYTNNPNDSVERPLVAKHQLSPEREADVLVEFKRQGRDPRILIVTDKLLTGFDAPLLYGLYLDKPMRDHVLLQAIARVNRPYVDAEGIRKRVGLIVDFVGVLRELKKALRFDAADVSGAIEDIDLLRSDLIDRIERAERDYPGAGEMDDAALEEVVYGRFLDPQSRTTFLEAFKEIEALWEIVSPDPALRDHVATFRRLAQWYAAVRNEYAERIGFVADLAHKTRRLVQESASQEGLGRLTSGVTFDTATVQTLREAPAPTRPRSSTWCAGCARRSTRHRTRRRCSARSRSAPNGFSRIWRPDRPAATKLWIRLSNSCANGRMRCARHGRAVCRRARSPSTGCSRTASASARRE